MKSGIIKAYEFCRPDKSSSAVPTKYWLLLRPVKITDLQRPNKKTSF